MGMPPPGWALTTARVEPIPYFVHKTSKLTTLTLEQAHNAEEQHIRDLQTIANNIENFVAVDLTDPHPVIDHSGPDRVDNHLSHTMVGAVAHLILTVLKAQRDRANSYCVAPSRPPRRHLPAARPRLCHQVGPATNPRATTITTMPTDRSPSGNYQKRSSQSTTYRPPSLSPKDPQGLPVWHGRILQLLLTEPRGVPPGEAEERHPGAECQRPRRSAYSLPADDSHRRP